MNEGQIALNNLAAAQTDLNVEVDSHQFEYLDHDNLNISCTNSSDFIVGKQTNFNGPVTIINCPTFPDPHERHSSQCSSVDGNENGQSTPEERIVIREKVVTASAIQNLNDKTVATDVVPRSLPAKQASSKPKPRTLVSYLVTDFLGFPIVGWFILIAVVIGITISLAVELTNTNSASSDGSLYSGKIGKTINDSENRQHKIYLKSEWGGLPASTQVSIYHPVPYIIISHTAGRFCYETATCMEIVRLIQKDHMSREPPFADIAYNFLVGGDGNIYEGRGWDVRSPDTGFVNNKNLNINFIGDFSRYDDPTYPQVEGVKALIQDGVDCGIISQNYTLIAANATHATLSPGKNVYRFIKTWDHFDPDPKSRLPKKNEN